MSLGYVWWSKRARRWEILASWRRQMASVAFGQEEWSAGRRHRQREKRNWQRAQRVAERADYEDRADLLPVLKALILLAHPELAR